MSSSYYDDQNTCDERVCHFLGACSMCNKQLGLNHDIFMYRGNTPFCSEECRRKQIQMDDDNSMKKKKKKKRSLIAKKRVAEAPPQDLHLHKK